MASTHYIGLLRGVNVGGGKRIAMAQLRELIERRDCGNVSTYINSGNVIFTSRKSADKLAQEIEAAIAAELAVTTRILIKTAAQISAVAAQIPSFWEQNVDYRADAAYLFAEADRPQILDELPFDRNYVDVKYAGGALLWRVARDKYELSKLGDLIKSKFYKQMTIRNVNTARRLAQLSNNNSTAQ